MYEFKSKKLFTTIIVIVMVLSMVTILSVGTQDASAASGSMTLDPTVYSSATAVMVLVNGGTFTSTSFVTFFLSTTVSFTSRVSIGTYSLSAGSTTLTSATVKFSIPTEIPGTYYIAASDNGGSTFTSPVQVTVTSLSPSISLSSSTLTAGGTASVTGSGFDPSSTVSVYLNYPSGPLLIGNQQTYTGYFSGTFTVPLDQTQSNNPFYVVAQESSSGSPNSGITADKTFNLKASLTSTVSEIAPSVSSSITLKGYGFSSGATIGANALSFSVTSGSITSESNPLVTTSATGQFSVTATFDSATATGPVSVSLSTNPSSSPTLFSSVFFISQPNPSNLKFSFSVTPTTGSTYNVGNSFSSTLYNFPSSQNVQIVLGSTSMGVVTTDSNGFGTLSGTIPMMPGGQYTPTAETSSGLYATVSAITISPYFEVVDSSNTLLTTTNYEYVPSSSTLVIKAYGLTPTQAYDATDSLAAPSGLLSSGLITSVTAGTSRMTGLYAASNGTLIFSYLASYSATTTGMSSSISLTGVSGYSTLHFGYKTIGLPTVTSPSSFSILTPGSTPTLTVTGLIPYGSQVYPGVSYYYNAYLGGQELSLTFSSTTSNRFYAVSGTFSGKYTVPSSSGLFNLSITYNGVTLSSPIRSQYVIVSTAGISVNSGALSVVPTTSGYEIVGWGYIGNPAPKLYYMTSLGLTSLGTRSTTNGAFYASISPLPQPQGTYSVFTVVTSSSVNYYIYSSYTVVSSISSPAAGNGIVGNHFVLTAKGLEPNTYYNVLFGNSLIDTEETFANGTFSHTETIPVVPAGDYVLSLASSNSPSSAVISTTFEVTQNPNVVLAVDSQYAFPGELVQFSVSGMGTATFPSGFTADSTPSYSVTINLNGTSFETVPASLVSAGELTGSFQMPNGDAGSYYLATFYANETVTGAYTIGTTSPTTGYSTLTEPFSNSQSNFLGLAQGNGAYIIGISPSQIAEIEAGINSTLSLPISQLNAAVSSINGDTATIITQFGTMTATLNSIGATILNVQSGVVTISSLMGNLNTSLASLNSSLVSFNGNIATINTTLGNQNVTLNSINTTVSITKDNTAVIKTDVGAINGTVTSISNGVATIKTKLGTVQTNTSQILPTYGTSFAVELLILLLVSLAVAFSAAAMVRSGRGRRDY